MLKWVKKYFIPHEHNEFKPHVLRNEAAMAILAIILIVEGAFLSQALLFGRGSGFLALIFPNTLVDQTNQERLALGLGTLRENPLLTAAAQQKANDMARKGYFAHTSPDGVTPWYWIQQSGYAYTYAGENLAVNFSDSMDVTNAWMKSPAHRDNIVNSHYTEIGIATAQGTYQGASTVFVVQMFGRPAAPKPAPASVASTQPTPKPAPSPIPKPAPKPQPKPVPAPVASSTQPASQPQPQQNFVAVAGLEVSTTPAAASESSTVPVAPVAATAGSTERQSSVIQRILAAPRLTTNVIYIVLGSLILLALVLNLFIKVSVQHPRLVLNGLVLLFVIGTLAVFNQQLLLANAQIF